MMTRLSVQMFGKLCLRWDQDTPISLDSRKALELFCYLLLYPKRPHNREYIAATIWAESSANNSKKYLRQALWQLQSSLMHISENGRNPILVADSDWIQVNPKADLWVDATEFEQAFTLTKGLSGSELDEKQVNLLKNAAALYRGDFLESCYEDWCLYERERLQNMYLAMLDKLMEACERSQQYEEALVFGEGILRYDLASERTHRRMIRNYYKAGKRTDALRQYERCVAALKDELEVKPAQKTVELYEQIRRDHIADSNPSILAGFSPASSFELLAQLEHLRRALDGFYEQALEEIHTLESALRTLTLKNKK